MNTLSSILFVGIFSMTVVGQLVHETSTTAIRSDAEDEYTTVANNQDTSNSLLLDESDCVCTPFNLCKTYVSAPNGEELIDIRSPFGPCDSYLDVCCNDTKLASNENINLSNTDKGEGCICIGQEEQKHSTEQSYVELTSSKPTQKPFDESSPLSLDNFATPKEENKHTTEKPTVEFTPSYPDNVVTSKEENKYNTEYPLDSFTPSTSVYLSSSEKKYEQNTDKPIKTITSTTSEYHSIKEDNGTKTSEKTKCGIWNRSGVGFRIVNAIDGESQYGEFPSMIGIFKKNESKNGENKLIYHCGGSLIEENVVLTAAHCVIKKDPSTLVIRAGEWDLETDKEVFPHQDRRVKKIVTHSDYYAGGLHNDVALIFTDEPFILHNHVNTICLPEKNDKFVSKMCLSSGWGSKVYYNNYTIIKKTQSGKTKEIGQYQVNILKKVELQIVDSEKCVEALRSTRLGPKFVLHDSFICAGGEEGKDTCKGDGGSPLMCQYGDDSSNLVQVGIVAWGINCGNSGIPAVYVDVAHFSQWIQDQIKKYIMY